MTQSVERWLALGVHPPLKLLRRRKLEATQALLGDTITFSDDTWQEPSRLPGWTRAHVAVHLARNADALRRVIHGLFTLQPQQMYPDAAERVDAIERGSRRGGLDLQIDLDTSAGRLSAAFDDVEDSGTDEPVQLTPNLVVPAPIVALARLSEVVLHHSDLGYEHRLGSLDPETARWLAAWELFRGHRDERLDPMVVHTDSGLLAHVGPSTPPVAEVDGSDADIVRWLSGRGDSTGLTSSAPVPGILHAR